MIAREQETTEARKRDGSEETERGDEAWWRGKRGGNHVV
jgi:hypothetical protein